MLQPAGRTVMISGANRGVGNATARALHGAGYNVSAGGRDVGALRDSLADLEDDRLSVNRYDADDASTDEAWMAATLSAFGGLDALVNNAGILDTAELDELTEASLDAMFAVNVKAPFRLIKLALPHLRACGHGRIVNLASLSGQRVKGTFAPGYAISKHAVIALTEAVKQAAWDDGVRVTAVCPGFIATEMVSDLGIAYDTMIQPADLAELILTTLALPNTAAVSQLNVACRLEPHF